MDINLGSGKRPKNISYSDLYFCLNPSLFKMNNKFVKTTFPERTGQEPYANLARFLLICCLNVYEIYCHIIL